MTAADLQLMLANRHCGDVFVPECKDGPTQTRAHRRLDAWVLLKTWSPITTIGYEIKVDRGDWRRDAKIADYMPLCHLLYVVAPRGVVPMDELPAGVGLVEPVGQSGRLQIRRKAARREIALPSELMVYVLMCRSKITRENYDGDRGWRVQALREWVQQKDERVVLSHAVSEKIRRAFDEQEQQLRRERQRNDELEALRSRISELGFDVTRPVHTWEVRERVNAFNRTVDRMTLDRMRRTAEWMRETADTLERIGKGQAETEEEIEPAEAAGR